MKRTYILANTAFDKAAADITGVYTGLLDAARISKVLIAAKKAGHSAVRVMIDNEIIRGVDGVFANEVELVMLHFVVGVDVPGAVIVTAVNAWRDRVSEAFFEVDLA